MRVKKDDGSERCGAALTLEWTQGLVYYTKN